MARLIPLSLDETSPPGEQRIFNIFKRCDEDWTVIHSLDLAPWDRQRRTELDFLAIHPQHGIICLEIKSHRKIAFDGNTWTPTSFNNRSPFKQSLDARKIFERHIHKQVPATRGIPITHCSIFTHSRFELKKNIAVKSHELIDTLELDRADSGEKFSRLIITKLVDCINSDNSIPRLQRPIERSIIEQIVNVCTPRCTYRPDKREEIEAQQRELDRLLLTPQSTILNLASNNQSLVVRGGAGTGKTLVAMEVARKSAQLGNRTGLLCFNRGIADHMARTLKDQTNLIVGTAHKILSELFDIPLTSDFDDEFWEAIPARIQDQLTDPVKLQSIQFDSLVIDEAQDLMARPQLFYCLMSLIPAGANCHIFGDFENQVLWNREEMDNTYDDFISQRRPALFKLDSNCRNYKVVGDNAVKFAGSGPNTYTDFLRGSGSTANFGFKPYKDDSEQLNLLKVQLQDFKDRGFHPSEITVLSFNTNVNSVASRLSTSGYKLSPFGSPSQSVKYCSVDQFKGLENKVIIISDVTNKRGPSIADLLYTGITRGTEFVRVLTHESAVQVVSKHLVMENKS